MATLWTASLALSYATELRSERSGRTGQLAQASLAHFVEVSRLAADAMAYPFSVYEQERKWRYQAQVPAFRRRTAGLAWLSRRTLGKLMSILRLLKALFTFAGGLDYIAWKLQRHSGQEIVIPPRVRQYPLLFVWGFCWRLYRRGVFK